MQFFHMSVGLNLEGRAFLVRIYVVMQRELQPQYFLTTLLKKDGKTMGHIKTPEHIKKIADAQRGRHFSDERKRNISEALKKWNIEHPGCHGRFGKSHTEETKLKISLSRKGKSVGINNYWFGKHLPFEVRQKISLANKGKRLSDELRGKLSIIQKERASKETEEERKHRGDAMRGKPFSSEHREKISKAQLGKRRTSLRILKMNGGLTPSQTPEWRRRKGKEHYQRHIDKIRKRKRDYMYLNREKYLLAKKISNRKIKLEVFIHYGGNPPRCACKYCNEDNMIFLTLDHINGSGRKHKTLLGSKGGNAFYAKLKKLGYPEGIQVLCWNCNCGRSKNGGVCPHEDEARIEADAARREVTFNAQAS